MKPAKYILTEESKIRKRAKMDFFFFFPPDPVFWYYVKEVLNKHELQRFYSLKTITTDIGRGRAWLRCALNEHSLERYVHMLLADKNRLRYCIRCHCNAGNVHVLTNEIWRFKKKKKHPNKQNPQIRLS